MRRVYKDTYTLIEWKQFYTGLQKQTIIIVVSEEKRRTG